MRLEQVDTSSIIRLLRVEVVEASPGFEKRVVKRVKRDSNFFFNPYAAKQRQLVSCCGCRCGGVGCDADLAIASVGMSVCASVCPAWQSNWAAGEWNVLSLCLENVLEVAVNVRVVSLTARDHGTGATGASAGGGGRDGGGGATAGAGAGAGADASADEEGTSLMMSPAVRADEITLPPRRMTTAAVLVRIDTPSVPAFTACRLGVAGLRCDYTLPGANVEGMTLEYVYKLFCC